MANLPADLPTNWTQGQTVSPNGTEVGLTKQHGYNYLNQQVNATQTEVNNLSTEVAGAASQTSVDNISNSIGTTTDSGATSTTGSLMGKVNELLDSTSKPGDFYYLSDTERDTIFDTIYTLESGTSSSGYRYMYLGSFVAQKDGIITVVYNCKITHQYPSDKGSGIFYACVTRGGSNMYGSVSPGRATSALSYNMISTPLGSNSTDWTIPNAGVPIYLSIYNTSNSDLKVSINVRKGENIFFFGYVIPGDDNEGHYSKTTLTSNSLKISYADAPQQ